MKKEKPVNSPNVKKRFRLVCGGAVQGVGFRPTIFRMANDIGLSGFVRNSPGGVIIEIEGSPGATERFIKEFPLNLPPLAKLSSFSTEEVQPTGDPDFNITRSELGKRSGALSSPDSAICGECRAEMESPGNGRYHYPFTNCTNCGPRYTIISSFPYDRERTSMACFTMCEDCMREYKTNADRRYHAEATCCPKCGPKLFLTGPDGIAIKADCDAVAEARTLLAEGCIVAIKGLGGFQLAARADNNDSIDKLRKRKNRAAKPFAVMVRDLETASKWALLNKEDIEFLASFRSPILLVERKIELPAGIAPNLKDIGIFLPTTPLHVELFRGTPYEALIMTSGNASDEPIAIGNREALERLSGTADYFLLHDRDIKRRLDDSVMRSSGEIPFVVRRSRGFVPEPLHSGFKGGKTILATGGHLQNTACIIKDGEAFYTPHIGDLDTVKARDFLEESILSLETFLEADAEAVCVDLHPDYPSRRLGEKISKDRGIPLIEVQHHLAHLASILAEHKKIPAGDDTAYGIILDGTGFGTDGTAWGGEFLSLNSKLRWKRVSHLEPFPLIGNEKAVKEPWRTALALLAMGPRENDAVKFLEPLLKNVDLAALAKTTGWESSSGAGRLFEAAGALCGLATENDYEGEAAIIFESLAQSWKGHADVWEDVHLKTGDIFPTADFFGAFAERLWGGMEKERAAMEFHRTFSKLVARIAGNVFPEGRNVALSGGCFMNRILRTEIASELKKKNLLPLLHFEVPPGDGGISLGQAVLASRALASGTDIEEI
jgi:hydrogenase maturation protein HypF